MTHVSKNQLEAKHLNSLFIQLSKVLAKLNENVSEEFFNEFFGAEEKIMFAKRLAVIAMCIEGNTTYRIAQLLMMSPSTTERIKHKYLKGHYKHIELVITGKRRDYKELWEVLEIILSAGLPPRGKGRWKSAGLI